MTFKYLFLLLHRVGAEYLPTVKRVMQQNCIVYLWIPLDIFQKEAEYDSSINQNT